MVTERLVSSLGVNVVNGHLGGQQRLQSPQMSCRGWRRSPGRATTRQSGLSGRGCFLAYHVNPSSVAMGERIGIMRHTVQRCVRRAEQLGVIAAPDDSPRPGKAPVIMPRLCCKPC